MPSAASAPTCSGERAQAHLDPRVLGVVEGDVLEGVEVEVGAELAVEHAEHVLVELGRDAGGVVVGGLERVAVLDQVGAEQQAVARVRAGPRSGPGTRALAPGSKLPIVPPRKAISRGPPSGIRSRSRSKSQTTPCTSSPGYSSASALGGLAGDLLGDVDRARRSRRQPASRIASSRYAGLRGRARAELDQRRGAPPRRTIAVGVRARGSRARCGSGSTRAAR